MAKTEEILSVGLRESRKGGTGKKTNLFRLGLWLLAAGGALGAGYILYHAWPHLSAFLNGVGFQGNVERLRGFVLSFGFLAPVVSACLMVLQAVVLFLPAFPIFVVNALSFGPLWGMVLSWSSAVLGSLLCFAIAKKLGRPWVEKLVHRVQLETAESALRRYEKIIILFFGLIPVVSFDVISYAAGFTILTFWEFFPLVLLAQIPSSLFYTVLVDKIDRGTLDAYWAVGAGLFLLFGVAGIALRGYAARRLGAGEKKSAGKGAKYGRGL